MINTILRIGVVFAALAYLLPAGASAAPDASFNTLNSDFGTVRQGQVVTQTFTVTNQGDAPLKIEKVEFSMPGMKAKVKQNILPGQTAEVKIEWDTSRFVQQVQGQALLFLNDNKQPKVLLTVTGTVTSPIDILPYPAVYLSQFGGEHESRSVTIKNNQDHKVAITRLEPKGTHFSASLKVLEPGKEYQINVVVPPGTAPGRYQESLILHTDDKTRPRINIAMNILVKPDVFITQESLDFGQVSIAKIKASPGMLNLVQQDIFVKRKEGVMSIQRISTDIAFLDLKIDPVTKAQNFQVNVGLSPDKLALGKFSGSIILETDDPKFPKLTVPVSGEIVK